MKQCVISCLDIFFSCREMCMPFATRDASNRLTDVKVNTNKIIEVMRDIVKGTR